jgi:hypothetical protein
MRVYQEAVVKVAVSLTALDCATCGIVFGISTQLEKRLRESGDRFFCPNGHSNVFTESKAAKLERQLAAERERTAELRRFYDDERSRRRSTERSLAATKGQVTKLRKREQAGVCPYGCGRHFTNLERHIHSKHADKVLDGEQ